MQNPLREGLQGERVPAPCTMVIFGASGDLTKRKLVPALYSLARDRLLPIQSVAALGVDAGPAQLRSVLWDWRLRDAVLCTHGETIAQLFTQLAMDGMAVAAPLHWPKGSTWLLRRTQRQVHARYLGPLALDPVTTA